MAAASEQIREKGHHTSPSGIKIRRYLKKMKARLNRRKNKDIEEESALNNRYTGGWLS